MAWQLDKLEQTDLDGGTAGSRVKPVGEIQRRCSTVMARAVTVLGALLAMRTRKPCRHVASLTLLHQQGKLA